MEEFILLKRWICDFIYYQLNLLENFRKFNLKISKASVLVLKQYLSEYPCSHLPLNKNILSIRTMNIFPLLGIKENLHNTTSIFLIDFILSLCLSVVSVLFCFLGFFKQKKTGLLKAPF